MRSFKSLLQIVASACIAAVPLIFCSIADAQVPAKSARTVASVSTAEQQFKEAEQAYQEFQKIHVGGNYNDANYKKLLEDQLTRKGDALRNAQTKYQQLITSINDETDRRWALDSQARIGMMYEDFADEFLHAPVPKELSDDIEFAYMDNIIMYSEQLEQLAVSIYDHVMKNSVEHGIRTDLIAEAEKRLVALRPDEYDNGGEPTPEMKAKLEAELEVERAMFEAHKAALQKEIDALDALKDVPDNGEATGNLDKRLIQAVIKAHTNELRACYESGLSKDKNLAGKIIVDWMISPDGTVSKAFIKESTLNSQVDGCILDTISEFRFPATRGGGTTRVLYPFKFKPI